MRLKSGPKLRERESCSDIVQSACREAISDIGRLDCPDEPAFRRWLVAVAHHKVLAKAAHHGRARRDADREQPGAGVESVADAYRSIASPSRAAAASELAQRMEKAMDGLAESDRDIIVQVRLLGRSTTEIAAELGKTELAVRKMLSRARARLGLLLGDA